MCRHFSAVWSNGIVHTHLHTQTLTHTGAQADAGLLLGCPPCQAVLLLLPGTCHRGDSWLHHQPSPEGNSTLKERHHLSSFHLLTSVISATPFLLSSTSPLCPLHSVFHVPITTIPFHQKNWWKGGGRWKEKKIWQCFTSSWDCHSRLRAQDITAAFPLTSIQIWRGVSECAFYDGVLQREEKEIQSFFFSSLIRLLYFQWMCVLLKWKIHPAPELMIHFCCDHFGSVRAPENEHVCHILKNIKEYHLGFNVTGWWNSCSDNELKTNSLM